MAKAYFYRDVWDNPAGSPRLKRKFTASSKEARYYETEHEAASDCEMIFRKGIQVESSDGKTHLLTDFQVEEIRPGEFVIFCEAPFDLFEKAS